MPIRPVERDGSQSARVISRLQSHLPAHAPTQDDLHGCRFRPRQTLPRPRPGPVHAPRPPRVVLPTPSRSGPDVRWIIVGDHLAFQAQACGDRCRKILEHVSACGLHKQNGPAISCLPLAVPLRKTGGFTTCLGADLCSGRRGVEDH